MRKLGLCVLLTILVFFTPCIYAKSISVERDGPINIEHEPVLQADKVIYVKNNQLFFKKSGSSGVALSKKGLIYDFDMAVMDKMVLVAWSQNVGKSNNNLCIFRISPDGGENWMNPVKLLSGSVLSQVRVKSSKATNTFAISVQDSERKKIYVYTLNANGKVKNKYEAAPEKTRILFFHDILLNRDSLLLFVAALKEGSDKTEIIKYAFSKNYTGGVLMVTLYSSKSSVGFISCGECGNGKDFLLLKYAAGEYSRLSMFIAKTETTYDELVLCEGEDVARADFVALDTGHLLVVYSSEVPKKSKQRVFALNVDCARLKVISKLRLDNTYPNTTAWLPVVAKLDSALIVGWEDTRNIRSNIYVAYSPDAGKSWTHKNIGLSPKGRFSFRPKVSVSDSSFYIAWMGWENDTRTNANIALLCLPLNKIIGVLNELKKRETTYTDTEKKRLLEQRIREYWEALKRKDYKKSYSFFDPFYRAVVSYEAYAARMGHIDYNDWKIEKVKVVGNEGIIKAKVRYRVRNLPISGKMYSSDLKEGKIEDLWIFVDDQWFKKFVDYLSGGSSVKY